MDISTINDETTLKVLLADEYIKLEKLTAEHQQATQNIAILKQRLAQLEQTGGSTTPIRRKR